MLLLLAILAIGLAWTAREAPAGPSSHDREIPNAARDIVLYSAIVEDLRGGASYYPAAARRMRQGDFPLHPFVTMRLPTLAVIEAHLPRWAVLGLLWALVAGVVTAWARRHAELLATMYGRLAALAMLLAALPAFVQPGLIHFHEIWAGLLIALSLALWRPERPGAAIAIALAAALIRETATLYLMTMAALAMLERRRWEAVGWLAAGAVMMIVMAAHAYAVAQVVLPGDGFSPGWSGMLGPGYVLRVIALATALGQLPIIPAAAIVMLAFLGWSAPRSPVALRAFALILAYGALLSLAGRANTFYWGLMIAPVTLMGLPFAVDGGRDLLRAARG